MQLTASVIGQEYCRNTETQETKLNLKFKLSVRNIGDAPLIVSRFANAINRVVLSKSLKQAQSGVYIYDESSTLMRLPWPGTNDAQDLASTDNLFVTLKPGESFDYEYPQSRDITLTESGGRAERFTPGQYFLKVKTQTWQWDPEKIKGLEQRWAQSGSLFYWDITSEPLAITIMRLKALDPCK